MSQSYSSNLSDTQWSQLKETFGEASVKLLIPPTKPGGHPGSVNMLAVVNAIIYVLCAECAWHLLPHGVPAYKTVYHCFHR